MVQQRSGFQWRKFRRIIPLEIQLGLKCGSCVAISLLRSLVVCLKKFEEEHEDLAVFRHTDEKVDLSMFETDGNNEVNESGENIDTEESENERMTREFLDEMRANTTTESTSL